VLLASNIYQQDHTKHTHANRQQPAALSRVTPLSPLATCRATYAPPPNANTPLPTANDAPDTLAGNTAGIGRASYEGANKSVLADFFPLDRAAAFTNGMVAVGGSTLAAYFAFPGAYGSSTLPYY
jgi:hypothetical protein